MNIINKSSIIIFGVAVSTAVYLIFKHYNTSSNIKTYYITIENADKHDDVKRDLQEKGFDVIEFESNKLLFLATTTSNNESILANDTRITSFSLENKNLGVFS